MQTLKLMIALVVLLVTVPVASNGASDKEDYDYQLPKILNSRTFKNSVQYPTDCVRSGIEGRVLVKLRISEFGKITNYWVVEASNDLLVEACTAQIEKLKFLPAVDEHGQARPSFILLPVKFKLSRR